MMLFTCTDPLHPDEVIPAFVCTASYYGNQMYEWQHWLGIPDFIGIFEAPTYVSHLQFVNRMYLVVFVFFTCLFTFFTTDVKLCQLGFALWNGSEDLPGVKVRKGVQD